MVFFPEHQVGIINAWIAMVLFSLPILITVFRKKGIFSSTTKSFKKSRSRREMRLFIAAKFLMLFYFLYSAAVPLKYNAPAGITGIVLFTMGFIFYVSAWAVIVRTPPGRIFSSGPYRFSRHPVYLSGALIFAAAGLASASWFFLIISILVGASHLLNALAEEINCIKVFGEQYRRYMDITPRWFGLPAKSRK